MTKEETATVHEVQKNLIYVQTRKSIHIKWLTQSLGVLNKRRGKRKARLDALIVITKE